MKRDRIANEKVIDFFPPQAMTAGAAHNSDIFDTMRESISQNARENHTNILIVISIMSGWSDTGTLTIAMQHHTGPQGANMITYATLDLMGGMENEDLFLAEIKDFNRYVRLVATPASANVTLCAIGTANRSRREPVVQVGTKKDVTYNSSPITN